MVYIYIYMYIYIIVYVVKSRNSVSGDGLLNSTSTDFVHTVFSPGGGLRVSPLTELVLVDLSEPAPDTKFRDLIVYVHMQTHTLCYQRAGHNTLLKGHYIQTRICARIGSWWKRLLANLGTSWARREKNTLACLTGRRQRERERERERELASS